MIDQDKPLLFYTTQAGLANRLRALLGYRAMARLLRRKFLLCWIVDEYCTAPFHDIFEMEVEVLSPSDGKRLMESGEADVFRKVDWFDAIYRGHESELPCRKDFMREVWSGLQELRPRRDILGRLASFCANYDFRKFTGVHIRHTDNLVTADIFRRSNPKFDVASLSTLSGFIAAIGKAVKEGPIFLATDDHKIETLLTRHYGGHVVSFPKRYVSSPCCCTSAVQDALIEMLLLGRCNRIVGTYFSSFSEFSAIWGGKDFWQVRGDLCFRNGHVDGLISELGAIDEEQKSMPRLEIQNSPSSLPSPL